MSERIALTNIRVVLPNEVLEGVSLIIESGRIVGTVPVNSDTGTDINFDLRGHTAFPGFIDVHVHGAGGGSFASSNPSQHIAAREFHLSKGTTSLYATTVTADLDSLKSALSALAESTAIDSGSRVLGIHTEGPFISAKKPGAHQISLLRNGSISDFQELISSSHGLIKRVTLAPEIVGGRDLQTFLLKEGIQVSTGHSHATYKEALDAFSAGSLSVTHMFNAMSGFNHREPGLIGAVLDSSDVYTEIILDEVHVHPAAFRILLKSRPLDRTILITDAVPLAGMPDGESPRIDGRSVDKNGMTIKIKGTDILAGSALDMNIAVKNAARNSNLNLSQLSLISSLNAARLMGVADSYGSLEPGKYADIAILDSSLNVKGVLLEGRWRVGSFAK